ncbi:NAD(P)H-hydrate dehydratase [Paenibacillus lentus]|uniref:Bifunctional NAD(P)H-hydrate repair enzyme n=1 Tax=Paenibacillus lentus TaxID=1338368 RepID=A0A3S8RPY4_9BACL|nr:NAD(P)H-hydrate dehydratase [Paenibacillus lentus]AZK45001.1 NAD(P)H-hydrate dehydratase [Paenibacillus lentus]
MQMVTSEQMREIDDYTIKTLGIPSMVLMENAGRVIAEEVLAYCRVRSGNEQQGSAEVADPSVVRQEAIRWELAERERSRGERWLILIGKGNNGGDGLVCARHLMDAGVRVHLLYVEPPESLRGDAAAQHAIAEALGLPRSVYTPGEADIFSGFTGIVDALLGTGAKGAPRGAYASLIRAANGSGLPIVAADIPSGLDADTGGVHDPCIRARRTVSLAFLKAGLTQYPGAEAAGEVVVRYIGIPPVLPRHVPGAGQVLSEASLRSELGIGLDRPRRADGHKGTHGHVLLAAGSLPMSGAALLSAKAALRAGCGLATWALPAALLPHAAGAVPELMTAPIPDDGNGAWSEAAADEVLRLMQARDVLAVGPGLGRFPGEAGFLRALWEGIPRPLVVDADALNILAAAGGLAAWQRRAAATVLTPHPGEMARLAGLSTAEVQRDRLGFARRFAEQHGVTLVLKGARTVVADPDGRVFVNTTGHPGMATGGSGDVLTGIIASWLAQGLNGIQAAALGVYLHGLAGERAASARWTSGSLLAGDIVEAL